MPANPAEAEAAAAASRNSAASREEELVAARSKTSMLRERLKQTRYKVNNVLEHAKPSLPTVLKSAAIAGAGATLLYGAKETITAWGHKDEPSPLSHETQVTGDGTLVRTPDGGLVFIPTDKYLQNMKALGYNPGADGSKGTIPITLDQPLSPQQSADVQKNKDVANAFTNPWTLLALGGAAMLVLFGIGHSKKGAK